MRMNHWKKTDTWYIEWGFFTKYEHAALHIDFNLPTKKDPSFCIGFVIFTLVLFFLEVAYVKGDKRDERDGYLPYV